MSQQNPPRMRRVWALLFAGPLLFLAAIIVVSVYFGIVTRGDAAAIAERSAQATPYMLAAVLALLLLLVVRALKAESLSWPALGWRLLPGQKLWQEALIGAIPGIVLALAYFTLLSPALTWLQANVGDYVPAGELTGALGAALVPFFLANVVLAPFVEESLYRGFAFGRLQGRYGAVLAIVISCACFGLLHWTGGFWYIVLTGAVAGGLFAGLRAWRGGLVAPFVAHLALNILEFLWVWQGR